MGEINEITIPDGADRIAVKQYNDKIVIEFIPEEPKFKRGDILKSTRTPDLTVIFDKMTSTTAFDSIYNNRESSNDGWRLECFRHATKEEKQEFFDESEVKGKRWNAEAMEIEDILKKGDLAIFWGNDKAYALIRIYRGCHEYHYDSRGTGWKNAIKFESKEQFEKILNGEI